MALYNEPTVTINGSKLEDRDAMTVRVALEAFASDLINEGLGGDAHGKRMVELYLASINRIRSFIFGE